METSADSIDVTMGVNAPGNTLIGPYRPFALVRPGPDCLDSGSTGGYRKGQPIRYFSQLHVSGTGGGGRYGHIGLMPYTGERAFVESPANPKEERAEIGRYRVELDTGVIVSLAATDRCAHYRIRRAHGNEDLRIWFKPGCTIPSKASIRDAYVNALTPTECHGWVSCEGGWGHDHPYTVFYYAVSSRPASEQCVEVPNCSVDMLNAKGADAVLDWNFEDADGLEITIGISFVSVAQARANADRECKGKTHEELVQETRKSWNQQLRHYEVKTDNTENIQCFYSMLYRLFCMPGDMGVDDEFPLWHAHCRQFNDIFCLWDSCRTANPFFSLVETQLESDLMNMLLDVAEHTGWLPDAWISCNKGFQQGGCSADAVLSDGAIKGVPGVDYKKALEYMRKNLEQDPPNLDQAGRYVKAFRELGFVPSEAKDGCASRHIEYTFHDACIAQLAASIGDQKTADTFAQSAQKLWNLWHPEKKLFYPKNSRGEWITDFDPTRPTIQNWAIDPYFFEGSGWMWTLTALQDIPGLIQRAGGPEAFIDLLDNFFAKHLFKWKETILHTPVLYHYAGRPDLSAAQVRQQRARYGLGPGGIPDNEDMGANSAFFVASAIGLFPMIGHSYYLLLPPLFPEITLYVGIERKRLRILCDGDVANSDSVIHKAFWNGEPIERNWLEHAELVEGGQLHLTLASPPSSWGREPLPYGMQK